MATAAGIAIATAVIVGALIVGDSLKYSLRQMVIYRLGQTTHTVTAGDRIFTRDFALRLDNNLQLHTAPVLKTEAIVTVQKTNLRVNKVQVWGIDSLFGAVTGAPSKIFDLNTGEAVISQKLATRLQIETGEYIFVRLRYTGSIPSNTPFVSETGQTISRRIRIKAIAEREDLGMFNMEATQTAPYNLFINSGWLNSIMNLDGMANMVLVNSGNNIKIEQLQSLVQQAWQPEDIGLKLRLNEKTGNWKLTSNRVFIDDYTSNVLTEIFPDAEFYFTYFVNSIESWGRKTPYSFVASGGDMVFKNPAKGVIINSWLADDLQVKPGDSLLFRYYLIGPLRELVEKEAYFSVEGIISIQESQKDSVLMPQIPGLSDAGSCRDWDAGIPINLESIRQKDENYWEEFKGTPKAYISLERGQELWENRFGKLTTVFIDGSSFREQQIRELLSSSLDPFRLEFRVNEVKEKGLVAAAEGVDFSMLFAGLGIFIVLAGLLLTMLLLSFNLSRRQRQISLFVSIGFSVNQIRKILMSEALLVVTAGLIAGVIISFGYTNLVIAGLNSLWQDIVRTEVLILHFKWQSIIAGTLTSLLLSLLLIFIWIKKFVSKRLNVKIPRRYGEKVFNKPGGIVMYLPIAFFFSVVVLVFLHVSGIYKVEIFLWLAAGIILLASFLLGIYYFLNLRPGGASIGLSLNKLSLRNIERNLGRSFILVALLALGCFVIVVTAANRKHLPENPAEKSSGTGGFLFMAETTVPVLNNLNLPGNRTELGLTEEINFIQFLSIYDDDASCLNLNRVSNPRIIAVDPAKLEGRFTFVTTHPLINVNNPWLTLNSEFNGVIPAIADQSVMQWGLGKQIGDTLTYHNSRGEEVRILLVGGLANSIFQGNLIISLEHFIKHFPLTSGSNVFLIEASEDEELIHARELNFIFRDFGWDMQSTREKLSEFNTVENTYLSIFFMMGAFGMLLGTIGLSIIVARSMLERKNEIALLKALGFSVKTINKLFFTEYTLLLLTGIIIGSLSAIVATLPTFIEGDQNVSIGFLFAVLSIIMLNGLIWIYCISTKMVRSLAVIDGLRNE